MKASIVVQGALCALALTAAPGAARVTEINVTAVELCAAGASFGAANRLVAARLPLSEDAERLMAAAGSAEIAARFDR